MGLKDDLIKAEIEALKVQGVPEQDIDTSQGSTIEVKAEYTKRAIVNYVTKANFTITELNAPVVIEKLDIPEQIVDVAVDTLLAEYGPLLNTLKKIAEPLGLSDQINKVETEIENVIKGVTKAGASLGRQQHDKSTNGFEGSGYVFIGRDPDSKHHFDVDDIDGMRNFTKAKLMPEDSWEIE